MEAKSKRIKSFTQSITLKAIIVGFLTLILLIPNVMIQELIRERKYRSQETIEKINEKWSHAQTLCSPILSVPYIVTYRTSGDKTEYEHHTLHITPEVLHITTQLFPEERHYGIYKTILYKSEQTMTGEFVIKSFSQLENTTILWDKAYIRLGFSDLRGITSNIVFQLNGKDYETEASGTFDHYLGNELIAPLHTAALTSDSGTLSFSCKFNLNGSSSINYIPVGKTTHVQVSGAWKSPGYIGNFSPEHTLNEEGFNATWNILRFNRNIPDVWVDNKIDEFQDVSFGVNLVDTVDHYQQNMRSAKYSLMFIALTFVVFFFVEILTRKRIHPIQYLLVGIALILFYSLLLSISEQLSFGIAYIIASIATIGLITVYTQSIFKSKIQTGILAFVLCLLYLFLYVILQLEDIALLIGSIGLFVILAIIMYFSRKVNWYKHEEVAETTE